jgi:hypothetical protein
VAATLVALVAAGLSVQAIPGAGLDREPRIRAVRPKADAFVSAAYQRQNFGNARHLKVDSSPRFRSYVTFNVDVSSDDVEHVSLLLYSRTASRLGYRVRLVDERWRERRITFANAPEMSPDFMMSGPVRARSWKAVDVTWLVADTEKRVNLALTTASPKGAEFASRETGLRGPRLVVERREEDTTTTRSTTTSTLELPGG